MVARLPNRAVQLDRSFLVSLISASAFENLKLKVKVKVKIAIIYLPVLFSGTVCDVETTSLATIQSIRPAHHGFDSF
jgi:hypothetical protein